MNEDQLSTMQHMLAACLNPDNTVRRTAEASITQHLNEHREVFLVGLTKLIRQSPSQEVRVLCAVILRQVLPQGDTVLFLKLSPELQLGIQTELLTAITQEENRYVRTQISDTIASLASVLIYQNKWPGLFEALYAMCQPGQANAALKICALSILGQLSDAADNLQPQAAALHAVFMATLDASTNNLPVRVEACVACCKIIGIIEEKAHTTEFQKFMPAFLQTLGDTLNPQTGDEDMAKRVLCSLTEVATEDGKYFEPHLHALIPAMYAIGADANKLDLDDGIRQYACEVLTATAERAPTMVRKNPGFIKHALLVTMSLLLDVEDDPTWGQKNDTSDFFDNSNFDFGEDNMDRLCLSVKGNRLWPILRPILESHLSNKNDWRYRHAGLTALAQACGVLAFEQLPVKEVAGFILDPHPRVRFAAVQCLGQFPVDFEVATQTKWHKTMFPALMKPLEDFANPRIQSHAASALLNMVDGCPAKIVKLYLAPLMNALMALLKQSHQMVQDRVLPVMAALAGQVPKAFLPYYDQVVPPMIYIIEHAVTKETRMLRARAMESVSYIGMYVGREKFHADAKRIVELFFRIMQEAAANAAAGVKKPKTAVSGATAFADVASDDDYSERHMLEAWTRICACLGEEFVPVLPYVVPQAFAAITKKVEGEFAGFEGQRHRLVDDDGEPLDGTEDAEEDANVSKTGHVKSISVSAGASASDAVSDRPTSMIYTSHAHTAALEDKARAMSMVVAFAHDLRAHFMPYVKQMAEIFIPLMSSYHEEIKGQAIEAMPHIMLCAVEAHKVGTASTEFVKTLFEAICSNLLVAFPSEASAEILATMVVAVQDLVVEAGPLAREVVDSRMLDTIGEAVFKLLTESHSRIEQRERMLKMEEESGDMDEERIVEIEERNSAEDGLNNQAAKLIEVLIKSHGEQFIPTFDKLFPQILRMMSVNSLDTTKRIAIFIVDDVFEHLGAHASRYFSNTLEAMCIYASGLHEEHGLRQAAAYGLQVAAKHGGPAFQPFAGEIASRLIAAVKEDPTYLLPAETVGTEWQPKDAKDEGEPDAEGGDENEEGEHQDEDEEEDEEGSGEDGDPDEHSRHASLDNLVSALGAVAFYQNRPDIYATWLSFLPLRNDEAEGPAVYNMLLDLIDANTPQVLGENFANLPKILTIFLSLVSTSFLKNALLRERVGKFFHNVKQMPQPLLQQVVPHLPEIMQAKLAAILQAI